jgi:sugar phosphate isomerase/epimerase
MKVGLQIYTVRNSFKADPYGTLEQIAKAGFKYIEMANHNADNDPGTGIGLPVKEFKKKVDDLGIKVVGAHILPSNPTVTLPGFYDNVDNFTRVIEFYSELGSTNLSIPIDFFPTKQYLIERCKKYNKIGEMCKKAGIYLLYHNHYNEFQRLDGEYIMDLLVNNTDSKYMGVELDAYWMIRGLLDPTEIIRRYGKRIALIHEKDFPLSEVNELNAWNIIDQDTPCDWNTFHTAVKPSHFIEVGYGIIKVQDVIDAGNEFGIPYIFVEQDYSKLDEISSINKSMGSFKKMRGLDWN